MGSVTPKLADGPARLESVGDRLWQIERTLAFPAGLRLPARMTILGLSGGELALHSPISLDDTVWRRVDELGRVRAVIAPNSFHHAFVDEALDRFPDATLYTAPGLPDRVDPLPRAVELGGTLPEAWRRSVDQRIIASSDPAYAEVVFFHRPSRTLLLTDLAFNGTSGDSTWHRFGWRIFGVSSEFGPSRNIRWTFLRYLDDPGDQLRDLLDWNFERIAIAHGGPVVEDAPGAFREAFSAYL